MMALRFHEVYLLRDMTHGLVRGTIILVGARVVKRRRPDDYKLDDAVEFLSPETHQIFGVPVETGLGTVRVQDTFLKGAGGMAPVWEFIPMTLASWRSMGERGSISGYGQLRTQILDEGALRNFYLGEWLFDAWQEHPEADP